MVKFVRLFFFFLVFSPREKIILQISTIVSVNLEDFNSSSQIDEVMNLDKTILL